MMMNNVGSSLRLSKIAHFNPKLPQVYTTDSLNQWGGLIKSPFPKSFKSHFITLKALDTKFNVPNFKLANEKVRAVKRLKEQVPFIIKPLSYTYRATTPGTLPYMQQTKSNPLNLASLPTPEFATYLHRKVNPNGINPIQWYTDLNIVIDPKSNYRDLDKAIGHVYTEHLQDINDFGILNSSSNRKLTVYGKLLQQYQNTSTIGVAGFVVLNEDGRIKARYNMFASRHVQEFDVDQVQFDQRGRLVMRVSATQLSNNHRMHIGLPPQRRNSFIDKHYQNNVNADQLDISAMMEKLKIRDFSQDSSIYQPKE